MEDIKINQSEGGTLSISCSDSVGVKDKTTFDSCIVDGIKVTYWMDDDEDIEERINRMFDIFFEEVVKNVGKSETKVVDY